MKTNALIISFIISSVLSAQNKPAPLNTTGRLLIAGEMEKSIETELLNKWYPQSTDSIYGGFFGTYTYNFKPVGPQDKFIVSQARHTWTNSKASRLYPDKPFYIKCAEIGFHFLRDKMWDKTYGGFYNFVDRKGNYKQNARPPKDAYGNAFAIYALSAYSNASGDTAALNLAKRAFLWLEKYSHDPIHKGYFQHLNIDGKRVLRNETVPLGSDIGYKDQNSSIHLLEAFTELYTVWPDPLVRQRLEEMLYLIRDKITTKKGYLTLFFESDWKPVSFIDSSKAFILKNKVLDHVSFGHDVETAYLMLEASHLLGLKNDTLTMKIAKKMVDHALKNGWDSRLGGFYDEGYYFKGSEKITLLSKGKNWWAQAEGMNALLVMADLFPGDAMQYFERFKDQWRYIQQYIIDHQNGDWYAAGLDTDPEVATALKGHIWKATYHQFRALANCIKNLKAHPDNAMKD
ncbi:MAG: AGE family epimerase/isomerase [Ferruginibacter sp.]